jgi:hypothetical protein
LKRYKYLDGKAVFFCLSCVGNSNWIANFETFGGLWASCLLAHVFTCLNEQAMKIKLKVLRGQIGKYLPLAAFLLVLIAAFEVLWGHIEPMASTAKMLILVAENRRNHGRAYLADLFGPLTSAVIRCFLVGTNLLSSGPEPVALVSGLSR